MGQLLVEAAIVQLYMPELHVNAIDEKVWDWRNAMNLSETQKRILKNKIDKGFNITDINKEFCLLYGEVAEAYDAFRKDKADYAEELADIAIYLMGIAEISGIDLEKAIEDKMAINEKRIYKKDENGRLVRVDKQ